jgi:antitoxin ParD1/3/4
MTSSFRLTPQAAEDLDRIWWFIAEDSRNAADRVEAEILATCRRLARSSLIGHLHRDLTPLLVRFWTLPKYPNYVIVYRPETKPLEVVAILHGRQDLKRELKDLLADN